VRRGAQGAGLASGLLPYDLRRAAIRNLIRSGVSTTVAMKISGHLNDSTFRRYDIASVKDIADAVEKVAAYVDARPTTRNVLPMAAGGVKPQLSHNRLTPTAPVWAILAEADGNRTHRSGGQPGARRL
jgi:hypothetical protein